VDEEESHVVFKMGAREQAVTIEDARHILGHLVENSEAVLRGLLPQLKKAIGQGGGVVRVREEWRGELLLVFDAIEELGRSLTEDQSSLREALREPILLDYDASGERERGDQTDA